MPTRHTFQQKKALCIVLFVTIAAGIIAACGSRSSVAETGSISPSATVSGYGTAHGCPSNVVVSTTPAAPTITIVPKKGSSVVNAHKGDVIEIHMPFGLAWEGPTASQGVLQLQKPYGYAWKPSNACIWRFVAKDDGTVNLAFFGRAICKKVSLCVPSVAIASYTIKVS